MILIHRDEVLGRLQGDIDYDQLKTAPEWRQMNVFGQIEVGIGVLYHNVFCVFARIDL